MKGYKLFTENWKCPWHLDPGQRKRQYACHRKYDLKKEPVLNEYGTPQNGMYFYRRIIDCLYEMDRLDWGCDFKIAEVDVYGVVKEFKKHAFVTNKLKIVRELSISEINRYRQNIGENCYGIGNTGNNNTGNENSGSYNYGNCNLGSYNCGHYNSGNKNYGHNNSGDCNLGDNNSGSFNIGDHNTGDFNVSSYQSGCFNTKNPTPGMLLMFNRPSCITVRNWMMSEAREILMTMPAQIEWMPLSDMSQKEQCLDLACRTVDGTIRTLKKETLYEKRQQWWNALPDSKKQVITSLPNFEHDVFKECTGIEV